MYTPKKKSLTGAAGFVLFAAVMAIGMSCQGAVHAADGFPAESFISRIIDGSRNAEDVLAYRDGAAYISARLLEEAGHSAAASELYLLSLEHESAPYAPEAGLQLLESFADSAAAESAADTLRQRFPDQYRIDRAIASYWYERESEQQLGSQLAELVEYPEHLTDPEVYLWLIVHGARSEGGVAREPLTRFLTRFRADDVHWRLERYITYRDELRQGVDADLYRILRYKAAISQGEFRGSAAAMSRDIRDTVGPEPSHALLWDLHDAARLSGRLSEAAAELADIGEEYAAFTTLASELAGRLLAQAGRHEQAVAAFEQAIEGYQGQDAQFSLQRSVWNWWRSLLRQERSLGLEAAPDAAGLMRTPGYFNDLLHDLVSELVRDQDWSGLERLYLDLENAAAAGLQARMAWILAEARRMGAPLQLRRTDLLEKAAGQDEDPYYRMAARIALGQAIDLPETAMREGDITAPAVYNGEQYRDWAEFAYSAGLLEDGYRIAHTLPQLFSPPQLVGFAEQHHDAGAYIDGMRLVDRTLRAAAAGAFDDTPDTAVYKTLTEELRHALVEVRYPQAFRQEVQETVERYDLYPPVFYGLVREESYFDAGIQSRVGASGLTQLMPATAGDMVRLLRMQDPDLSDPLTNLTIGGFYYQRLLGRFERPVQALVAYNAGQGRVRRWQSEDWVRSDVLFHEGLPFEETRHYIRKILVTAVHYADHYYDGTPAQVFSHIFPDFEAYTLP